MWHCVLAFVASETGDETLARREFDLVAERGFDTIPPDTTWIANVVALSEACANPGEADQAAELYELLLPYDGLALASEALDRLA